MNIYLYINIKIKFIIKDDIFSNVKKWNFILFQKKKKKIYIYIYIYIKYINY